MTRDEDRALDQLIRLVGAELARSDDELVHHDEALLRWLADDLRAAQTSPERDAIEKDADAFVAHTDALLAARRAEQRLPIRELRARQPTVKATVAQSIQIAVTERCAALLDLAAAAGPGRELWDEPCATWIELDADLPADSCVALRVAGDSMLPVLRTRDTILVKLGQAVRVDDMVVARVSSDGYVVKRVSALSPSAITLASYNPSYAPLLLPRDACAVMGTVVARFRGSSEAAEAV